MPIHFHCACGQSFTVPDSRAGQTATCAACQQELQVPATDQATVATLPPKRRRRKQATRPRLSKDNPSGEVNITPEAEMTPVVVVLVALCLLYHGHVVLRYGIWQPITRLLQSAVLPTAEETVSDATTMTAALSTASASASGLTRWLGQCLTGLGHISGVLSMAGLLFWRRHAVTGAIVSAILLLLAWLMTPSPPNTAFVYAAVVSAIVVLLKKYNPGAWVRLMHNNSNSRRVPKPPAGQRS